MTDTKIVMGNITPLLKEIEELKKKIQELEYKLSDLKHDITYNRYQEVDKNGDW